MDMMCPYCEEGRFRVLCAKERMVSLRCDYCDWESDPFVPRSKEVETTRQVGTPGGCHYETYDQYGRVMTVSQGFDSVERALEEARRDAVRDVGRPGCAKVSIVVWPHVVEYRATAVEVVDVAGITPVKRG
jgi:hypothetical protein